MYVLFGKKIRELGLQEGDENFKLWRGRPLLLSISYAAYQAKLTLCTRRRLGNQMNFHKNIHELRSHTGMKL